MRRSTCLSLAGAALFLIGTVCQVAAAGLPVVALATELKAVRTASVFDTADARLICSTDTSASILAGGKHFDASALSIGLPGVTSCRWFVPSGTDWVEAPEHLADVAAHVEANFMAPTSGAEPRLYELVGIGATGDFDAAIASITSSYGAPQATDILAGIGKQDTWHLPGLNIVVSQKDPQYGNLVIDYLQPDLEEMVAHPF